MRRRSLAACLLSVPLILAAERPAEQATRPSAEEVERAVAALQQRFAAVDASGPATRRGGTLSSTIRSGQVHFATAQIGTDGKVRLGCVRGTETAARRAVDPAALAPAPATE